jgi:hypothetical protein
VTKTILRNVLIFEARGLVSGGENPEYDRALVELVTYSSGGTQDDFLSVSKEIFGVERPDLWGNA